MDELVLRGCHVAGKSDPPSLPDSSTALGEPIHSRARGRHSPPTDTKQMLGYGHDDAADTRPSMALVSLPNLDSDHTNGFVDLKSPTLAYPNHDYAYNDSSKSRRNEISRLTPVLSEASSYDSSHMDWSPPSPLISSPNASDITSSSESDTGNETPKLPRQNHGTAQISPASATQSKANQITLLPLPTSSPGYVTHAHQEAMKNRIPYDSLLPQNLFDPKLYTPVFLHDTLMLPGSLANLIGKVRQSNPSPPETRRET